MSGLLSEIVSQVHSRRRSAEEVARECLVRVRRVDPELGAFLSVEEDRIVAEAQGVDRRIASGERPPLAGVPVAVKDNIAVAGYPATCGSKILDGFAPGYDATAVARLREAGAVVAGKTNLDEFAMGSSTENSAFHATRNPWDPARVPGGSSGGSAAAVAAGLVPAALGSDTGGSVRQPAALCGVVGYKPTYGRVSRHGLVAFASSLDQIGPLARGVEDAARIYAAIAGPDPRDSTCGGLPAEDPLASLPRGDLRGTKIGLLREAVAEGMDPEAGANFEDAVRTLRSLGASVLDVSVPVARHAISIYYVVANAEASSNLARYDGIRYGSRSEERELVRFYERTRTRGFGAEVKRRVLLGTFVLSAGYRDEYYGRARRARALLSREFDAAFGAVDLIACPTVPAPAFRLGEKVEDPLAMYLSDVFTTPASLAGLPAISVPSGCSGSGLPLALQLVGPRGQDGRVLGAAAAFEREIGFAARPKIAA